MHVSEPYFLAKALLAEEWAIDVLISARNRTIAAVKVGVPALRSAAKISGVACSACRTYRAMPNSDAATHCLPLASTGSDICEHVGSWHGSPVSCSVAIPSGVKTQIHSAPSRHAATMRAAAVSPVAGASMSRRSDPLPHRPRRGELANRAAVVATSHPAALTHSRRAA